MASSDSLPNHIRPRLLHELEERGLLFQITEPRAELAAQLQRPLTAYCGFDPSADSLHTGHLLPLFTLQRLQRAGHRVIALVGGATGLIGDPSFRSAARDLEDADTIAQNAAAIRKQIGALLGEEGATLSILDNREWTAELKLLDFLRQVGRHFSVNEMIRREAVQQRLQRSQSGISLAELCYMTLQAYDFAHLQRHFDCLLQIGGSDQWGNITAGLDLVRRLNGARAYAFTLPLLTKEDGSKFGKTSAGTIWLAAQRTSPYAFYQFWLNSSDQDAPRLLRYLSDRPLEEIDALAGAASATEDDGAAPRRMQEALAAEITERIHGRQGLEGALRVSQALFAGSCAQLSGADLGQLELDGLEVTRLEGSVKSLDEILMETGLALTPQGISSLGQARKLIRAKAVRVNDQVVDEVQSKLRRQDALHGKYHVLRRGKKLFHLLRWT